MKESEKTLLYHLESMRDGCSREVLYEYMPKEEIDAIVDDFISRNLLIEGSGLLFINYDKVTITPWIDAQINEG